MHNHGEKYKKMEIIAEEILFSGDAKEIDLFINEQLAGKE